MKIQIFVVSRSQADCDHVGLLKERAIPDGVREKLKGIGVRAEVRALHLKGENYEDIAWSVLNLAQDQDDVCVLTIGNTGDLNRALTPHVLCYCSDENIQKNPQNILGSTYTSLLRRYLRIRELFQSLGHRKLIMLPRKNCRSSDLNELLELSCFPGNHGDFVDKFDRLLAALRRSMKPKKKTADPSSYFVDEEHRHYQLGHEQHALASDKCPPHRVGCVLGINFRMGIRMNRQDHYNVTEDGDFISGVFEDCHDEPEFIKPKTHLNMFPCGQI